MKTIHIDAIDRSDYSVHSTEVFVLRIFGWYVSGRVHFSSKHRGLTTIISLDSGAEYEIAESIESFRARLAAFMDDDENVDSRIGRAKKWARLYTEEVARLQAAAQSIGKTDFKNHPDSATVGIANQTGSVRVSREDLLIYAYRTWEAFRPFMPVTCDGCGYEMSTQSIGAGSVSRDIECRTDGCNQFGQRLRIRSRSKI